MGAVNGWCPVAWQWSFRALPEDARTVSGFRSPGPVAGGGSVFARLVEGGWALVVGL